MPVPRGRQVPFTSALSGLVLLGVMFTLAAPIHVAAIFAAWALVYLGECVARDRFGLRRHLLVPEVQAAGVSAVVLGGAGADLALETSDVVIVRGDLAPLPAMIRLSRHARRVMIQNFVLAAAVIIGLVAYDLAATLPLPVAVAGHEGSTLLVALNGLRLLRSGVWGEFPRRPARRPAAAQLRRFALAAVSFVALGLLAAHQLS
jgi:hypothetical protein